MRLHCLLALPLSACIQLGPQNKDSQNSDPVDAGIATPLIGFWDYDDDGTRCAYTLSFGTPTLDGFRADTFCQLADGTLGLQSRVGTYVVPASGTLNVTITSSTCATDTKNEIDFSFASTEQGLDMTSSDGNSIVYSPAKQGSPKVSVSNGCFATDGSFTPSELKPL